MRIIITSVVMLLSFLRAVHAQELIIKGKIKCLNTTGNSTKGAENIVVVPGFMPSHSTITASRPAGYFEFKTGLPISKLQDKIITVYAISHCSKCKEISQRVFISEDQDRQNKNDAKQYVTIKDWMLKTNCNKAELAPLAADSVLRIVIKEPNQDINKVSSLTAVTGAPAFLNFLTDLVTVVGVTGVPTGDHYLKSLDTGRIKYGRFLLASPLVHSANTGFNFSPGRDMSEAVFWNPSAIAMSRKLYNISLLTNLKNNIKAGAFARVTKKLSIGLGFIHTQQDEFRVGYFYRTQSLNSFLNPRKDSAKMLLKEFAAFLSPVFKVNDRLSAGITVKSVWQKFNYPLKSTFDDFKPSIIFYDTTKSQYYDLDFSATYKINRAFQIGLNVMNLAGKKMYAQASEKGCPCEATFQAQRSLGFGVTYKWKRLNAGTDILFTEDGLYDASLGVNYVPFNNALLSAGMALKQKSYSFAFRIKHFRVAYINDNNWMTNDQKKGKSPLLNGRLYGGFIVDFNGFKKDI